jgi:heptosyltransferase-1
VKVLIVRIGAMGDVLHALPAVAALRAARPEWEIDWAVEPRWAQLLVDESGRGPIVDKAVSVWAKEWSRRPFSWATVQSILQLRRRLRAARYDIVIDMQGTLRSAIVGWFAGAAIFAGYNDPRERWARWFYSLRAQRTGTHVVEQGAALLGVACGLELPPATAVLPRSTTIELWAEHRAERPMAMLSAGAGWGAKQWPVERFGELAERLRAMGFSVRHRRIGGPDAAGRPVRRQ